MSDTHKDVFLAQSFPHTTLLMRLGVYMVATLKTKTQLKVDRHKFRIFAIA